MSYNSIKEFMRKWYSSDKAIAAFIFSVIAVIIFKTRNQLSVTDSFISVIIGFVPFYIFMLFVDKLENNTGETKQ